MQLSPEQIDAWFAAQAKGKNKTWPRVLAQVATEKEVHWFGDTPRVLAVRTSSPKVEAHLFTTSARLKQGPVAEEIAALRDLLTAWKPSSILVAWPLNDAAMGGAGGPALADAVLAGITKRKVRYYSLPGVITTQLEQLFAATAAAPAKKRAKK
jgi:hypothetical protein